MYITLERKAKKVKEISNLWDLRLDEKTNKIIVSDEAYDRLNMKENNFILAINPENETDFALEISNVVTDNSFYVTQPEAKRAKNKSFKDDELAKRLRLIGSTEFILIHAYDNIYKVNKFENTVNSQDLISALNSTSVANTVEEPVIVESATEDYYLPF